jgi:peptide/nickel transport system permease protein
VLIALASLCAPFLGTIDPNAIHPSQTNMVPGESAVLTSDDGQSFNHTFWMGSDGSGRDVYSRVLFGVWTSLKVGIGVALLSLFFGLIVGLTASYIVWVDTVIMRFMDGLMAIPGVLLALFMVALWRGSMWTVILAITLTEVPRVGRLARSVALLIRQEPYIEAAIGVGTSSIKILYRHILPNTIGPMLVQGTYVCALAMLVEAILSFLGVGLPLETPSLGNVLAEGKQSFNVYPHNVFFPGLLLALTVLSINLLGDGLRDTLDPRFNRRGERR